MNEWTNWSESLRFSPAEIVTPKSEDELADVVKSASQSSQHIRVVGAGHSSSPLVETTDTLIKLDHFHGLRSYDKQNLTAEVGTSMNIHDINAALQRVGLALFNTGDVDVQMLAGAIATGTHGSGKELKNLASVLVGARMVTGSGDIKEFTEAEHPDLMNALRVSLGCLGIFTSITIKVKPLFRLRRLELCTSIDYCMTYFHQLAAENRNADFYWYPRSDLAKIRLLNEPGSGSMSFPFPFQVANEDEGFAGEVIAKKRELKFDEMEYAMDESAGMACFREIRKRVKEKHRREIAWRILYRVIAPDTFYLSPHYQRRSVSISLHHHAGLPYDAYFNDIEPIFIAHGGRPHWAKKHSLKFPQLHKLYPDWDKFQARRKEFDPNNLFINNHLANLFDV